VQVTIQFLRYLGDPCTSSLDYLHDYPVFKLMFRKLNATALTAVLEGCSHSSAKEKQHK